MLEVSDLKIDLHPLQERFWEDTYDDIVELVLSKMFIKTLELAALTNNVFQRLYGKKSISYIMVIYMTTGNELRVELTKYLAMQAKKHHFSICMIYYYTAFCQIFYT